MSISTNNILIFAPYPQGEAPSQRFRFEQYVKILEAHQFETTFIPFLPAKGWEVLFKDGKIITKLYYFSKGFVTRILSLLSVRRFDFIFIHREATPIGPPIVEWIIANVFKKKIIYDFDDAIWLEDPEEKGTLKAWLKCKWKVAKICKWSYKVSVGNEYLAGYAGRFNKNIVVNPTTVDTEGYHNPALFDAPVQAHDEKVVIGWTGSHSTLHYLKDIIPVIKRLESFYGFTFLVIANKQPSFKLNSLKFIKWSKPTEIQDLMPIDIGIMPLTDDPWSKGKCGFKAIQYLALGKPALVSPVGVNQKIVQHGVTGFHCQIVEEWKSKLELLLNDAALRKQMGKEGRKFVENNYSASSNTDNFLSLFT